MNNILKVIKEQNSTKQLEQRLYFHLRKTDSKPASFYGLPKIHKPLVPLRPITSAIDSPTYELSKHLSKILSPLQRKQYTVKNSTEFAQRIINHKIEEDEVMVSFDVVSLFTSIPTALAIDIVEQRLSQDNTLNERTNMSVENIMKLLKFVLYNNFFTQENKHYKQIFGCPMGSPVSPILANLIMEDIEEKALSTAPNRPKWWYRYVDDSHVCLKQNKLDEFHNHLNSINRHIQFTVETENNGTISFLDTSTTRQEDGTISVEVFRKATNTNKYLSFSSHHPIQHKRSVVKTLLNRADLIPSNETTKKKERDYVYHSLALNGYPAEFVRRCNKKKTQTNPPGQQTSTPVPSTKPDVLVTIPYFKGISERITKILKKENIQVAHKPIQTVNHILPRPKDKPKKEYNTNIVYQIKCKSCIKSYIGQTSRALHTRINEHRKAVQDMNISSLIAKHCLDTGHKFDFDNPIIRDHSRNWAERLFLEAYHSETEPNSVNEHIEFPTIYKNLALVTTTSSN